MNALSQAIWSEASAKVLASLRSAIDRARARGHAGLVRAETTIPDIDPLRWLLAQDADVKTYWADRDTPFRMAGIGAAHTAREERDMKLARLFRELRKNLPPATPRLRYYGGARFDQHHETQGNWSALGSYHVLVPQIEIVRDTTTTYLACNAFVKTQHDTDALVAAVETQLQRVSFAPVVAREPSLEPLTRVDHPSHDEWLALVDRAIGIFDTEPLQKVVLARETQYEFASALDPVALLARLTEHTTRSYHFCFQPAPNTGFIGASPERLFLREGNRVYSEALAGTRPRGATEAEDDALAEELLASEKDCREHRFVLDSIRDTLARLCSHTRVDRVPAIVKLQHCQHLCCLIEGELSELDDADVAILRSLHPTPAVGGYPADTALEAIRALEPFDRGWYAGPVGWLSADGVEFSVAIRSGLVDHRALSLYSGAGIVPGSKPENEWNEIENKMKNFKTVLSGND